MDVDSSYNTNPQGVSISVKDWDESPPSSAAPTITNFNALFYNAQSPPRPTTTTSPPVPEFIGKRRSHSPESVTRSRTERLSSPPPSSPSMRKLERIVSAGVPNRSFKPGLDNLGVPSGKRPRRPVLSAIGPVNLVSQTKSAYPTLEGTDSLFPPRRAFSAMIPPGVVDIPSSSLDEESFDSVEASPAQAYMKRQKNKTLRRCDGSDNLRPDSATRLTPSRQTESPRNLNEPSPRSRWLAPGFGDNEAHGKILPCHRVKEDGLMRINQRTVRIISLLLLRIPTEFSCQLNDLLDGLYDSKLTSYHIIDCRFDYEYNGGHIPSALNINTTAAVEEFLLGANALKPKPSVSGDASGKTVLIFHCEFSAKRAPTLYVSLSHLSGPHSNTRPVPSTCAQKTGL
jgi:M-phase inducer tyrosine phosphatase